MATNNCDIDGLLKLNIAKDRLSAVLRIEQNQSSSSITRDSLTAYLGGCDISAQCILFDEIDKLVEAVGENPTQVHEMIVVKGKHPVEGKNAEFVFSDKLKVRQDEIAKREAAFIKAEQNDILESQAKSDIDDSDTDPIDFYNESPFLIVDKGEIIGKVIEASPGLDGIDVTGQSIATKQGKNLSELIDKSFQSEADGSIRALIAGHLTFKGMRLRINPTLEISGFVDFSTGNIDFPKDVIVNEGVRDRFTVKSNENIEIRKLVEASILESAKDITLHNGMAGRDTGTLSTGGDLRAGYLDGVRATVRGNCEINKEITNCQLSIAGKINSPVAAIRGGEIHIAKGGVFGSIGSIQGVVTDLILGSIPEIEQKIRLAMDLKPKIVNSIEKQEQELETYKSSIGKPNREQETEIWYIESELKNFKTKLVELDTAIDRLGQIIHENTEYQITVKSSVFAKTTIWLPGYKATFENDVKGELTISLDQSRKPIIIRNGTSEPLRSVAKIIADDRVLPISPPKQESGLTDDIDIALSQAA